MMITVMMIVVIVTITITITNITRILIFRCVLLASLPVDLVLPGLARERLQRTLVLRQTLRQ